MPGFDKMDFALKNLRSARLDSMYSFNRYFLRIETEH